MKKKFFIFLFIFLILTAGIYAIVKIRAMPGQYDGFAQCLTEKQVTMYGTDWCKYCQQQKGMFGKSFKYVNYVNCDFNEQECDTAGVQGYPTWEINGEVYSGVQPLEYLSSLSECEL